MTEFVRLLVAVPLAVLDDLWSWLRQDEDERFIAEQRERLRRMWEGE